MALRLPAAEVPVADLQPAPAGLGHVGREGDDAPLQRHGRGGQLEGRGRRIPGLDGAVEQRPRRSRRSAAATPCSKCRPRRRSGRRSARCRARAPRRSGVIATMAPAHCRAPSARQRLSTYRWSGRSIVVRIGWPGMAGSAGATSSSRTSAAPRVHLDVVHARPARAGWSRTPAPARPAPPPCPSWAPGNRALLQVLLGDLADVPHEVRHRLAVGIEAPRLRLDDEARQDGAVLLEPRRPSRRTRCRGPPPAGRAPCGSAGSRPPSWALSSGTTVASRASIARSESTDGASSLTA